jgi:hypothetical protein
MKAYKEEHPYEYLGDTSVLDGVSALCTSMSGMMHLDFPTGVFSVIRGANIYGLTRDRFDSFWYAERKFNVIKKFRHINGELEGLEQVVDLRTVMCRGSANTGVHGIDFIDDDLYIMDTYNNRCLIGRMVKELKELRIMRVIYPRGAHTPVGNLYTKNGYHGHFNTIYSTGDYTYMLAHNNTTKTKVASEMYVFYRDTMKLAGIIPNIGSAAHDLVTDSSGKMYMCDSGNHAVKVFDGAKFNTVWEDDKHGSFTRGLAMNDDINIIGGSFRYDDRQEHREDVVHSLLFVTDKDFNTLCTIKLLKSGQIHQIRFTELDYGYSNTWSKHGH